MRGRGWGSEECERMGLEKRGCVKGRGWRVWLEEERVCEGGVGGREGV